MMFNQWTEPDKPTGITPAFSRESILANEMLGKALEIELKRLEDKFKDFVTSNSNQSYFRSSR